jgi:hypothetical protein
MSNKPVTHVIGAQNFCSQLPYNRVSPVVRRVPLESVLQADQSGRSRTTAALQVESSGCRATPAPPGLRRRIRERIRQADCQARPTGRHLITSLPSSRSARAPNPPPSHTEIREHLFALSFRGRAYWLISSGCLLSTNGLVPQHARIPCSLFRRTMDCLDHRCPRYRRHESISIDAGSRWGVRGLS